jgi:spore maturation protein CgeB
VPPSDLVETILYYLDHPELAAPIIERAYTAATQGHRFQDSVHQIMQWAEQGRRSACRVVQSASTMYQPTHMFTIPLF